MNGLVCGVESGFQEASGIFTRVSLLEYSAASDQDFSTRADDVGDGVVMDAAVYFDAKTEPARVPDFREQLNFLQGRVDKGLTTEAGVHAHNKDMMNQRKNLIEGVDRCGRVYDYSRLTSVRCDQMKGAIEMDAGFLVDGDPIRAGFGKGGDELVRPFNHEMAIERNSRDSAKRSHDGGPDCDVGDEMTIHHVHMQDRGSTFHSGLGFCTEAGEVSR